MQLWMIRRLVDDITNRSWTNDLQRRIASTQVMWLAEAESPPARQVLQTERSDAIKAADKRVG